MAHRYTVIFEKEEEGGYHVFCPTLPGCHTQSDTIEEGIQNIVPALREIPTRVCEIRRGEIWLPPGRNN
jgi:hypothetical protein